MKLPNSGGATVTREKIVDYLLNSAHPDNGGKAEFFRQLGFRSDSWEIMAAALKNLAATGELTNTAESPHGKKYVIVGQLQSPGGRTPLVQSIWIVDKGLDTARLMTVYPHKP